MEAELHSHSRELEILELPDFDLDLVANTKLALDMLRAAHASEDASSHHDAQLG